MKTRKTIEIHLGICFAPGYWGRVSSTGVKQPGFKRQIGFGLGTKREKDFLGCHAGGRKIIA